MLIQEFKDKERFGLELPEMQHFLYKVEFELNSVQEISIENSYGYFNFVLNQSLIHEDKTLFYYSYIINFLQMLIHRISIFVLNLQKKKKFPSCIKFDGISQTLIWEILPYRNLAGLYSWNSLKCTIKDLLVIHIHVYLLLTSHSQVELAFSLFCLYPSGHKSSYVKLPPPHRHASLFPNAEHSPGFSIY